MADTKICCIGDQRKPTKPKSVATGYAQHPANKVVESNLATFLEMI